jgi:hypothetical protein
MGNKNLQFKHIQKCIKLEVITRYSEIRERSSIHVGPHIENERYGRTPYGMERASCCAM